jgi:hypothetical protein
MANIKISFKGKDYSISDSSAFEAGAAVEDVVTFAEMASWGAKPKFFTLARAIGALLRFAGAKVSDREVKAELDRSLANMDAEGNGAEFLMGAIGQLQAILFDGAPDDDGETPPPGKKTASSKARIKSR